MTHGAGQNRLEHTYNVNRLMIENLTAAESRISDADLAQEMANFTKQRLVTQAASAMLAQANVIHRESVMRLIAM